MNHSLLTVSELTKRIKHLLEDTYPAVWVTGEISNFKIPVSGHYYFSLKDAHAQISGVMFRNRNRYLKFTPEDGMTIIGMGRVGVYEPRGTYQIIFETLEPRGVGALQIAFEQLKAKLADEGLFDAIHKKTIPLLPGKIGVITSRTGAVVHDIMDVAERRFPGTRITVIPVKVQGDGAVEEIAAGIALMDQRDDIDVAIIARGGGSLEDLQAFNSEAVARAIFAAKTPIISAVGHETDVTIADFTADLRAPTPSAAAEIAVPKKSDLQRTVQIHQLAIRDKFKACIERLRNRVFERSVKLVDPRKRVQDLRLRIDDLTFTLQRNTPALIARKRERLAWATRSLHSTSPMHRTRLLKARISGDQGALISSMKSILNHQRSRLNELAMKHQGFDPRAILKRGYSITRTVPDSRIVRNPEEVEIEQKLSVTVEKGTIVCRVEEKG